MTAHQDTFVRDHLPDPADWPELIYDLPVLHYPQQMNSAATLLDEALAKGHGGRAALLGADIRWTYDELKAKVNQAAHVLTDDLGLIPGNRILLRGPNHPLLGVLWLAAVKAGLVVVTTMPLLRRGELAKIIEKARIQAALCDSRFLDELAAVESPHLLHTLPYFDDAPEGIEARMQSKPTTFEAVATAADDPALIAFTSGSTGEPKATVHTHRDVLAICDCFPRSMLDMRAADVCIGSPPLGFTFGLGGLLLFPLRYGAATVLIEKYTPRSYLEAIEQHGVTISWTAPFFYRKMADVVEGVDLSSLRACVSAGETLPPAIRSLWRDRTGIEIIDGIGSTEMLHIFISHMPEDARPGATGKPIPGYRAKVVDADGRELPLGEVGFLAVQGPTGCRYLDDARQQQYVQDGWNLTGDAYSVDEEGYFVYQARTDDMINTTGYKVAGPEVEAALLAHEAVVECAVVGAPDAERGTIIKAYVVLKEATDDPAALTQTLQDFVKATIAPYKYPRAIEFVEALPRTQTGKVQRYVLRERAAQGA